MASSARLKFKVVRCSSEDPDYPVSELLSHSSQTKGWQTAKFCDFPQELVVQFETPVHLRQVQFLSHQSKIATKIELFTALPAQGEVCHLDSLTFKRLGYLSLDSNERSQFQARELKSVYVDVSVQFVRVVLHKCHVNRYNIVNQVGLIALNCLGETLGPDLAVGPPPPNPTLARNSGATACGLSLSPEQSPPHRAAQPIPSGGSSAVVAAQAAADEMRYDAQTMERIRALEKAKSKAVDAEDYAEAKRCKEMLVRLRQTGQMLNDLEERKRQAVADEDYDAAKALKVEIDRLRFAIERPERPERPQLQGGNDGGGRNDVAMDAGLHGSPWDQAAVGQDSSVPPAQQVAGPKGLHQAAMAQGPTRMPGSDQEGFTTDGHESSQGKFASAQNRSTSGSPAGARDAPMFGEGEDAYHDPPPPGNFDAGVAGSPCGDGTGGAGIAGGQMARTPVGGGGISHGALPRTPLPERASSSHSVDLANHPLRGVPNLEELGEPDPLPAAVEKDAEALIQLFGDYVTRCLYSKAWSLRDAALQKLALDLRDGETGGHDPSRLLRGYLTVLKRTIADKAVQVFLSSGSLLLVLSQHLLQRPHFRRERGLVESELDPIMPLLVDRLGDANARLMNTTRDALLDFARCSNVGTPFTTQYLLKAPKKKGHARVYSSRLQLLTVLVSEAGVQPESKDGVPLDETMKLAMDWFSNPSAEVRDSAVKLVAACHARVGLTKIEKYLANLRPAQRGVFDDEFERSCASATSTPVGQGKSPRHDEADHDDAPQVRAQPSHKKNGKVESATAPVQKAPEETEEEYEDFTCQFCGHQDPSFDAKGLDVHYWRECPMLIECEFCRQVIEISTLRGHLSEECESGAPARAAGNKMAPNRCPLCREDLGSCEDLIWQEHFLQNGCPKNKRIQKGSTNQSRVRNPQAGALLSHQDVKSIEEELEDAEEEPDEFTCQFCGRQDSSFTSEALDMHYARECPCLIECDFCQQVIEISTLGDHLCDECEGGAPARAAGQDMAQSECPLCREDLGACEDLDWRDHLLKRGCPQNRRSQGQRQR